MVDVHVNDTVDIGSPWRTSSGCGHVDAGGSRIFPGVVTVLFE